MIGKAHAPLMAQPRRIVQPTLFTLTPFLTAHRSSAMIIAAKRTTEGGRPECGADRGVAALVPICSPDEPTGRANARPSGDYPGRPGLLQRCARISLRSSGLRVASDPKQQAGVAVGIEPVAPRYRVR